MDHDPYFAGRPPNKSVSSPSSLLFGWGIVYGLNLLVPLLFGMALTHKAGRLGMGFAILLLFGLGRRVVSRYRKLGKSVIIGGGFVAVAQIFPLIQVYAGSIGISVVRDMGQTIDRERIASEFGGFVATVVTGGVLIVVALVIGWMVQGVSAWIAGSKGKATKKSVGIDLL